MNIYNKRICTNNQAVLLRGTEKTEKKTENKREKKCKHSHTSDTCTERQTIIKKTLHDSTTAWPSVVPRNQWRERGQICQTETRLTTALLCAFIACFLNVFPVLPIGVIKNVVVVVVIVVDDDDDDD